jgi:catechol 2,3-dioxygenase-like lactoylglutathione lyase family enzyme
VTTQGLNHVSVTSADLDRSLGFYGGLLGLKVIARGETDAEHLPMILGFPEVRLRWAELELGNDQIFEVFEYLEPRGTTLRQRTCDPGCVHIALQVDDLDRVFADLREAGVTTRSAPVTIATGNWAGARCLYALDPDGVTIELVEPPGGRGGRQ